MWVTNRPDAPGMRTECPTCHSMAGVHALKGSSGYPLYYCPECQHMWDVNRRHAHAAGMAPRIVLKRERRVSFEVAWQDKRMS